MDLIKKFIHLTAIPLSLGFSMVLSLSRVVIAESAVARRFPNSYISQNFTPPNRKAPRTTAGGGSRGDSCDLENQETLMSLIPQNKLGLTFADRPTFYWLIRKISVETAHFSLLDDKGIVYTTTFKLPNQPGIFGFTLPANAPSLKVGEQYHWYMAIACNAEEPEKEIAVDGWVERILPTSDLSQQLTTTNPQQLAQVYATAGIWHEALHTLIQQRLRYPSDRTVISNWKAFLESVDLKNLVSQPLVTSSTAQTK